MVNTLRNFTKKLAGLLPVSLILASIIAPTVYGQANQSGGFNFSTSPVVANLDTKPGTTLTTKIQVKNNGTVTEHIKVHLLKFKSDNVSGNPLLTEPEANDEFVPWVTFSEKTFDAEPNVWKDINVTVATPSTAAFGYYYAVAFSRSSETQTPGSAASLTGTIAVPILLNVETPNSVRKADITQFSVSKNIYEFLPAKFTVALKNSGNTHVAPRGNIVISKGGKSVGTIDINAGKGNILPNSSRQFAADWSDGSPVFKVKKSADGQPVLDKKGQPVYSLDWSSFNPSKIRFGKYHAKIVMVYNDGHTDVATEGQLDFWVIPWRIIGVMLVVILLLVAGLYAILIRPLRMRIKKLPAKKQPTNHN